MRALGYVLAMGAITAAGLTAANLVFSAIGTAMANATNSNKSN